MLQTEEVDDDYFTPVASASLANIFDSSSLAEQRSENESLKYIPPKPQPLYKQAEDPIDPKATSCIFACVLVGYEWDNNVYSELGKLGFALIKFLRTGLHKIILYDSNKTTLSDATISSQLKVNSKSQNYISYYDDHTKYWSLYGKENEIVKIIEQLKVLGATITTSEIKKNLSQPKKDLEPKPILENINKNVESDTDSSINKKTKASILNRMANMGHSVLPPISAAITSDSSDTDSTDNYIKAVRHKSIKSIIKRNSTDKTIEQQRMINEQENIIIDKTAEIQIPKTYISDQLVPISQTTYMTSPSRNDMNIFISEQRISNSEMRINIARVHDKVDHIVEKINFLEVKGQNEGTSNVNTEILHKLLREYENKINVYEELLRKMGTDVNKQSMTLSSNNQSNEVEILKAKIESLERMMIEKDDVISSLQNKIHILEEIKDEQCDSLQSNVSILEADLSSNKQILKELSAENEKLSKAMADNAIEKIKSLMNDTYQAVATNFESGENYSGESVKKAIALIMKKLTLSALSITQD